jgi:hypothetical protein
LTKLYAESWKGFNPVFRKKTGGNLRRTKPPTYLHFVCTAIWAFDDVHRSECGRGSHGICKCVSIPPKATLGAGDYAVEEENSLKKTTLLFALLRE